VNLLDPLFAAPFGVDDLITLAFFVVMAIVSLIRYIAGKNQPQAQPPKVRKVARPAAPRDEKISNEIEVFLQQVTGRNKPAEPRQQPPPKPAVVREPPRERPPLRKRSVPTGVPVAEPPRSAQSKPLAPLGEAPGAKPAAALSRPGAELAERKGPGSLDLGTGVREHLSTFMDPNRLERRVQQDMKPEVEAAVQAHLGQFGAEMPRFAEQLSHAKPHPIVQLLRDPQGVRQAILIKEILERPTVKGRRRSR